MKRLIYIPLAMFLITTGCGGHAGTSENAKPETKQTYKRPWPEALQDSWTGTCEVRRYILDSLTETMSGQFTLSLSENTFEYRDSATVVGRGTYTVDGPRLMFTYLLMDRITKSPFNLEGPFDFIYRDSVLILLQHEAVGPAVRLQPFVDKELTLKRVKK